MHGQNFHLRCRDCLLEYNWIARAQNYEGDLMTTATGATQKLVMRGNVIVQGAKPENNSFIIAPFNDDPTATNLSFEVDLYSNTIIVNGGGATLLMFNNKDIATSKGVLANNAVLGNMVPYGATSLGTATFSGSNNWLMTGATPTAALTGTVFGSSASLDTRYRPLPGSPLIGAADPSVTPAPTNEYFQDEVVTRMSRPRLTAKDIGAFESTTMGPGGTDGGPNDDGGSSATDAGFGTDGGNASAPSDATGGCGCSLEPSPAVASWSFGIASLAMLFVRRRRPR